jgi:hypothetical protein
LGNGASAAENLKATAILDWQAPAICTLATSLRAAQVDNRELLQSAHRYLVRCLRLIYTLDELQPASVTLHKQRGSCSQRMACLEAIARAAGVPTRVRALRISGQFWYPRFRVFRAFLPADVLLAWPQFLLNEEWVGLEEIYRPLIQLAGDATEGFTNDGESIFDVVDRTPIDFQGNTCQAGCPASKFDLSGFVLADEGFFATRDDVFDRFGLLQHTVRGRAFEIIFGGRKSS